MGRNHIKAKRGRKYRSRLEATVAQSLQGRKLDFEYETAIIPYTFNYIPDFIIKNWKDPTLDIYIEAKGVLKPEDRRKMLAVKRDNPGLDIRFIFQNPSNKLNSKSKTTYADWAEKNGFPWAHYKKIPRGWFD